MPLGDLSFSSSSRLVATLIFSGMLVSDFFGFENLQAFFGILSISIFSAAMVFPLMPDPSDFSDEIKPALILLLPTLLILPATILGLIVGLVPSISFDYLSLLSFLMTIAILPLAKSNLQLYSKFISSYVRDSPEPSKLGSQNLLLVSLPIAFLVIISVFQADSFLPSESTLSILDKESMSFPDNEYGPSGVELIFSIYSNQEIEYDLFYEVFYNDEINHSDSVKIKSQNGKEVIYEIPVNFTDPGNWRLEGNITSADHNRNVFHDFIILE